MTAADDATQAVRQSEPASLLGVPARTAAIPPSTRYAGAMRRALERAGASIACCAGALLLAVTGEPSAWARSAPAQSLDYRAAQRYVLSLINRDRARAGLSPVVLDEAASKAGRRHARDMAANGFTGHVGSDGSVPEQRYTQSGGVDFVQENAACLFDLQTRQLDAEPRFDAAKLAALHGMFMAERPPNDGHRRNILKPSHQRVGIGLAQPRDVEQPCLTQEFVDHGGEYEALPLEAKRPLKLHVAGKLAAGLVFGGVGLGRTPAAQPPRREKLNGSVYRIPAPDTMYFPAGFKTPKPVHVDGRRFSIDLEVAKSAAPGTYAVSVWAKQPTAPQLFMISMRTITVR